MEPQRWRGFAVTWTRPRFTDIVVSGSIWYLLYQDERVPATLAALTSIVALRCIRLRRTV
ncbi:hypothetical protein OG778_32380 [Streptomyces sp. NBC_00184]|uniref:hypothetical protein n=1 Tax=Streptomyces sp. NBC_00184 TaxID=2975673 RepID=UPI002E293807|nr:hypothetical protein [Streptomyces sp. NBC_00184]